MAEEKTQDQIADEKAAADKTAKDTADKAAKDTFDLDGKKLTRDEIKNAMELVKLKGSLDQKGQQLNEQSRQLEARAAEIAAAQKPKPKDEGLKSPTLWITNAQGDVEPNLRFDEENAAYQAAIFRSVQGNQQRGQILEAATIQINNRLVEQTFRQTHGLKAEEYAAVKQAAITGGELDNVGTPANPVYLLTEEALEKARDRLFTGQVRESLSDPNKLYAALLKLAGQADLGFTISKNPPRTGVAGGELQPLLEKAQNPQTFKRMTPEEIAILQRAGILPPERV